MSALAPNSRAVVLSYGSSSVVLHQLLVSVLTQRIGSNEGRGPKIEAFILRELVRIKRSSEFGEWIDLQGFRLSPSREPPEGRDSMPKRCVRNPNPEFSLIETPSSPP
eukprot:1499233-Amphidinium_carterae.1